MIKYTTVTTYRPAVSSTGCMTYESVLELVPVFDFPKIAEQSANTVKPYPMRRSVVMMGTRNRKG